MRNTDQNSSVFEPGEHGSLVKDENISNQNAGFSNRCKKCQSVVYPIATITAGGLAGVDKIKIGFSINKGSGDWRDFLSSLKGERIGEFGRTVSVFDKTTGAHISFFVFSRMNQASIYLEFNPSRFVDPKGFSLIHPEMVVPVVQEIIREYFDSGIVIPSFASGKYSIQQFHPSWKAMIGLSRLDLSRDMHIKDADFSPLLLRSVKAASSKGTSLVVNDDQFNGWGSLLKGRDGHITFYNKYEHAKKLGLNPLPTSNFYRFEYRLEKRHLKANHFHSLADLSEDRFEHALRFGWSKSRLGSPFFKPLAWTEHVTVSSLPATEKAELIGYLVMDEIGTDLGYGPKQSKTLRTRARSLGLKFYGELKNQGLTMYQLDLDLGDLLILRGG